jgi:transposase
LRHLLRQIPGKLLIIWDGSPIHRGRAVKEFLASEAAEDRLKLERLPGYAPDLNPDERVWKHLKYVELKNVCCRSLSELRIELRKAKERLRHKRDVILGCIRQPGFEVQAAVQRSVGGELTRAAVAWGTHARRQCRFYRLQVGSRKLGQRRVWRFAQQSWQTGRWIWA